MPLDEQQAVAVVAAHHRRLLALRSTIGVAVGAAWDRFAGLDDEAADRFVRAAAPLDTAAMTAMSSSTAGMYRVLDVLTGHRPAVRVERVPIRGGTPPADVLRRAIVTARWRTAQGDPFAEAMAAGRDRAVSAAQTDVILANRATHAAEGAARGVVGYRRVLTGESCVLCATASTQRYHEADLLPVHSHCDCDIAPIYGDVDPGRVIDRRTLDTLQARGPQYWKSRGFVDAAGNPVDPTMPRSNVVAVRTHGELGQVLTRAGHDFTGPADLAA